MIKIWTLGLLSSFLATAPALSWELKFRVETPLVTISNDGATVGLPQNVTDILPRAQVGPVTVDPRQALEELAGVREKQRTEEARQELRAVAGELSAEQGRLVTATAGLQAKKDALTVLQQQKVRFVVQQRQGLQDIEDQLVVAKASLDAIRSSNEGFMGLYAEFIDWSESLDEQLWTYEKQIRQNQSLQFLNPHLESLIGLCRKAISHMGQQNSSLVEVFNMMDSQMMSNRDSLVEELKIQSHQVSEALKIFRQSATSDENRTYIRDHVRQVDEKIETFFQKLDELTTQLSELKRKLEN